MDIKKIRKEMGLTQQDFANKLGITLSTVQRWEIGKNKPSRMAVKLLEEIQRSGRNINGSP